MRAMEHLQLPLIIYAATYLQERLQVDGMDTEILFRWL